MKRMITAALLAAGLLAGAAQADDALKAAIAGSHRVPANAARDSARHPYETLTFFGIKPTMTVVDLRAAGTPRSSRLTCAPTANSSVRPSR